jgi:hypothetical protein
MQTQGPARARDEAPAIGSDELAEGLMLVRASTLKIIRLQLAMERRDRRVALEEVDDLLALDRRLQDYLGDVERSPFFRELETERAALNREKLTLAAEVVRREAPPLSAPEPQAEEAPSPVAVEAPDPELWGSFAFAEAEAERRRRGIRWLALVLVLLSIIAGTAYVLASPEALATFAAGMGVLQ